MIRFIRRIKARQILTIKLLEEIANGLLTIAHNQERQITAEENFVNVISNFFAFEKRTRLEKVRKEQEEETKRMGTDADKLY
jgi:hypothetical protein